MLNSLLNQLNDILTIYCNSYFIKKITINISKPRLYTLGRRKCPSIGHFTLSSIFHFIKQNFVLKHNLTTAGPEVLSFQN